MSEFHCALFDVLICSVLKQSFSNPLILSVSFYLYLSVKGKSHNAKSFFGEKKKKLLLSQILSLPSFILYLNLFGYQTECLIVNQVTNVHYLIMFYCIFLSLCLFHLQFI